MERNGERGGDALRSSVMDALPARTVRLTRHPDGIELYFPPFRAPGVALAMAIFGAACLTPGVLAVIALAPAAFSGAAGMLALSLMSIFVLPFIAFGVVFVLFALYLVANSLTVSVSPSEIRSLRRLFGVPLRDERLPPVLVAALDTVTVVRYRWPRRRTTYFGLVARASGAARSATRSRRSVTLAESLPEERLAQRLKDDIAAAAGIAARQETGSGFPVSGRGRTGS